MVTTIDLPVISHVTSASLKEPLLGLMLTLEPRRVQEVAAGMKLSLPARAQPCRTLSIETLAAPLVQALVRLVSLLGESPLLIAWVAPLLQEEIIVRLLLGPHGQQLQHLVADGPARDILTDESLLMDSRLEPPILTRLFQRLNGDLSSDNGIPITIEEAADFFKAVPSIRDKMITLQRVGLDYIRLGQQATTLSGGEAQRVKLAKELSRRATGRTLYILDEPTTGLHFDDVKKLLEVLHTLVEGGNTVLVIEHSLEVIKTADWVVDMGPEGGDGGGRVVVAGPPEQVAACRQSHTGRYLAPYLSRA
jgi:hypothetical protein